METIQAIQVSSAWTTSDNLSSELKIKLNTSYFTAILDNIDKYDLILNYLSGIIWNYYKNYYLVTSTKERCIELLANELSGKLNYYYALINEYKKAFSSDYSKIRGTTTTNTRENKLTRDGLNKQATTPETIEAGADYIDDYSTSEQKYNSNATETGSNNFTSSIIGSNKDLWENINAIPKTIYESVIGLVSKYFFYVYDNELEPSVELTLEQAIKDLDTKIIELGDTLAVNVETIDNNIERLTSVTPTDIGVKEGKLGLLHDTKWLTNQGAITIGSNLNYIAETNTLNANVSQAEVSSKQNKLVSGTNIKTINGNSILGSGDLTISADKVFSIPIEQVITQEEIVDLIALMTNAKGSTKVVFGSLYDFDDVFNNYDCLCLNCSTITGGEKDKIILRKNIDLNESGSFSCTYAYMYNSDLGAFSIINVTISKSAKTLTAERISSTDLLPTPESDTKDGDVLIYDSKRTKYGQLSKWATLDFYKTISLFGNHSILVPKDSTDTNIDLYKHHINFTINELNGFFEFYSSKNLVCDSLTDLKTLLGNTFEIQAFGYSGTIETYTTEIIVQAVSESKLFISVGGQFKIQDIEEATFTDTVTTI